MSSYEACIYPGQNIWGSIFSIPFGFKTDLAGYYETRIWGSVQTQDLRGWWGNHQTQQQSRTTGWTEKEEKNLYFFERSHISSGGHAASPSSRHFLRAVICDWWLLLFTSFRLSCRQITLMLRCAHNRLRPLVSLNIQRDNLKFMSWNIHSKFCFFVPVTIDEPMRHGAK